MPVDVKKWLAEKAAEVGLDATETAAAEKLLSNPKFKSDFVPVSDFHSTVDKVKNTFQAKIDELQDYNEQWQDAYDTRFKPALDAVAQLQSQGYNTSGLRNDGRGGVQDREGNVLTREDVQEMLTQTVEPVRSVSIDYSTFITEKGVEYYSTYGKPFKPSKFREFAYENKDKYPTLDSAFDAFTAEDRKALEEKEKEDWKTAERDRIRLELMSSQNLPEAAGGEGSPVFIANDSKTEEVSRDANRQAFARQFANADFSKITP